MLRRRHSGPTGPARGLTLVELSAGLAISGLLLGGIVFAINAFQTTPPESADQLSIRVQLRSATTTIKDDVARATSFEAKALPAYGALRWLDESSFPPAFNRVDYFWEDGSLVREHFVDGVSVARQPLVQRVAQAGDISFTVTTTANPDVPSASERLLQVSITVDRVNFDNTPEPLSTTLRVALRPEQTDPVDYQLLFLHDNPTPPTGDTASEPNLPLDATKPTATTLFNYDTDRDQDPGLLLLTSADPGEEDDARHQDWVGAKLDASLAIDGRVTVIVSAAAAQFAAGRKMHLVAQLMDFDAKAKKANPVGQPALAWFTSTSGWIRVTLQTDPLSHTFKKKRRIGVTLRFDAASDAAGMLAYDTTQHPAFLLLPVEP